MAAKATTTRPAVVPNVTPKSTPQPGSQREVGPQPPGETYTNSEQSVVSGYSETSACRYDEADGGVVSESENPLVLVVDDEPSHSALVRRWLEHAGYQVEEARSGASCLGMLDNILPAVILLDIHMAGIDGFEVVETLKRRQSDVPVVMLTGDAGVSQVVRAMQAGAWDYVTKPTDRRKLITTIRNAADRGAMNVRLRQLEREASGGGYGDMVGRSKIMCELFRTLDRIAPSDVTVLIGGESGTGKELVARAIHDNSGRRAGPFVALNCAAVPENLQESELFGHEKGAFTGASGRRVGRFEQANGGTLMLDEVGELSPGLQAKLLRALQERKFYRVGGDREIDIDVRILAATHRDLYADTQEGRFRLDLFYRLAVFEVAIPPLRDRPEDVLVLARHFLGDLARQYEQDGMALSPAAAELLASHGWPGNVRELRNALERAVVAAGNGTIERHHLPPRIRDGEPATPLGASPTEDTPNAITPIEDVERKAIVDAIDATDGNVSEVIRRLGIPRTTLYRKLKKYGLR
jgi:DNA-binding NtrC family response regulator